MTYSWPSRTHPPQLFGIPLRDPLFSHWMDNPRTHTRCSTIILVVLCNALAIMEIRLLSLRGGSGRTTACKLTAAPPSPWKEFLGRPAKALYPNRIPNVLEFLQLQLQCTIGSLPHENHMVYLMLAGCNPYVGRTIVKRAAVAYGLAGITARWSEHVIE